MELGNLRCDVASIYTFHTGVIVSQRCYFCRPTWPLQQGVPALELGKFVAGPSYPSIANVNERGTLMAEQLTLSLIIINFSFKLILLKSYVYYFFSKNNFFQKVFCNFKIVINFSEIFSIFFKIYYFDNFFNK